MTETLDLAGYFERVGFTAAPRASLATLRELHRLHPSAIPFENLSTLIGEPVPLDVAALQRKLVLDRRGGYCFEQNRLFAEVLGAIGFEVTGLAARVVWNRADAPPGPRTHMVLLVQVGPETHLCDVGFGGLTLTGPLLFESGIDQETPHEMFRLSRTDGEFAVEANVHGEWRPLYRFDLQAQLPIDFEVLNHFVATHPQSPFRTRLMVARRIPGGGYALRDGELSIYTRGDKQRRLLDSAAELERVLSETFGISLPESPALRAALERVANRVLSQ